MEKRQLTARIMNDKIKYKFIAEEIAEYCGMVTEEFYQTMKKIFSPPAYSDFMAQLKQNKKFRDKHPDFSPYHEKEKSENIAKTEFSEEDTNIAYNKTSEENEIDILDETYEDNESIEYDEVLEDNESIERGEVLEDNESINEVTNTTLEELHSFREEEQNKLDIAERQHKALTSQCIQIRNELRLQQENYKKLLEQVVKAEQIVYELSEQFTDCKVEMEKFNFQIAEHKKNIKEIDDEIKRMQKITIFVYANSEIDIDSATAIEFSAWEELYTHIRADETLEDFTGKQLKSLAKVIVLVKELKANNQTFDISFDSPTLEEYFYSAINNNT